MIYVMRAGERGPVKIGYVKGGRIAVEARRKSLQTACPHELKTLACCAGEDGFEELLHNRFCDYRVHGEWFLIPADVVPEWSDIALFMLVMEDLLDRLGYWLDGGPVEYA